MKRLGVYALVIILMIACREKRHTVYMSGDEFLEKVFPTYSPIGVEFSKVVDAVVEFDSARYVLDNDLVFKFYDPMFGKGYLNSNFNSEDDLDLQGSVLELALENLSNDSKDILAFQSQLMDTRRYTNSSKLSKMLKPVPYGKHNELPYLFDFYSFDKPLFTADKNKALINTYYYCGNMCGQAVVYYLEMKDGKWKVTGYDYSYET